jgi:hypothetical protein
MYNIHDCRLCFSCGLRSSRMLRRRLIFGYRGCSWTLWPLKIGPIGCSEMPVTNCRPTPSNTPEKRRHPVSKAFVENNMATARSIHSLSSNWRITNLTWEIGMWYVMHSLRVLKALLCSGSETFEVWSSKPYSSLPRSLIPSCLNVLVSSCTLYPILDVRLG